MYIADENADRSLSMLNTEMSRILDRGELSKETLCLLGEIVDIMKDIKEMDGSSMDEGYSRTGGYQGYSNRMGRSYNGGSSYRRGYSRGSERDHLMDKMDQFMAQASTESERQLVQRIMNEI